MLSYFVVLVDICSYFRIVADDCISYCLPTSMAYNSPEADAYFEI